MLKDEKIVGELIRLAEQHAGELQPAVVVEAARDEASPLHSHFEWNDTAAAAAWRLQQARQLINVVVRYEDVAPGKSIPCRVFVSLMPDRQNEGGGYRLITSVMANDGRRLQLLADALAELRRVQAKYAGLKELADVFAAVDRVNDQSLAATA